MGTESATHIDDLDIARPDGSTEQVESLDDYHIQIKTVLQRDVNNFAGTALVYGADGSNTNAYAFTSKRTITSYTAGIICVLDLTGGNTNTAAATLNIDGVGVKSIVGLTGAALPADALKVGPNLLIYDGTSFVLIASDHVDINGGTIDGVTVGGAAAVSLNGTNVTSTKQTTGNDSTRLATTSFVQQEIGAMKVTSTAQTTYTAGTSWTYAHGKGSVPDLIIGYAVLQATQTDGGYSAGDKIMLSHMQQSGTNSHGGLQVWADDTNLGAIVGSINPLCAYRKTTAGQSFNLAAGEWDVFIEGVWFA